MVTKEMIIDIAKQCFDPEIPVNIWDLGLIYDIKINEASKDVNITMSLTTENCPSAKEIPNQLQARIKDSLKIENVEVEVVFEPVWTPERITEEGKKKLGIEA